jgi:sugar lactone lactonase YvrE
MRCHLILFALALLPLTLPTGPQQGETKGETKVARDKPAGEIEPVAYFRGPMPTGVTVSHDGRIFVCYPRWGDKIDFTVGEVVKGKTVAYPDAATNRQPGGELLSVQSVVIDPKDRLWALDTGSINFGPVHYPGPKLVGVDLKSNKVFKTIHFPPDVALKTTYVNDVRFDLRLGDAGMAFITDSALVGPNGIIVVDLASGKSWRRLHDHPSTKADKHFQPIVEGRPLLQREPGKKPQHLTIGSDGIAIGHDGKRLFYCPLYSRKLYSVSVDALADRKVSDEEVAKTVEDLGDRGFASDGLESDAEGRLYLSDYEHDGILRRQADGSYETLVHDPRVLWPDTLSLAKDGHLYFTANQLNRQARFHNGKDLRQQPYVIFRVRVDARPVLLK